MLMACCRLTPAASLPRRLASSDVLLMPWFVFGSSARFPPPLGKTKFLLTLQLVLDSLVQSGSFTSFLHLKPVLVLAATA